VSAANRRSALVGIDFARPVASLRPRARSGAVWLALVLAAALGLVVLRVDLLRVRYALASATAREEALLSEQRELTVQVRQLRDPRLLAERAEALGFVRPERVIRLGRRGEVATAPPAASDGGRAEPGR
jgi:hypothetical protein